MTQRHRSLLEAFKASGSTGSGAPKPAQAPAPPVGGGAPAPSPMRVSLTDSRPARSVVLLRTQVQLLALVVVLAVACAFLLGRASVRIAAAAGPGNATPDNPTTLEQPPAAQQPNPAQAQTPPPASAPIVDVDRGARSAAEQALVDPKNVWTIKLIEYTNTDPHKQLALDTSNYVNQQGLQSCVVTSDSRISILVGAGATQDDLDALLLRCQALKGPPPASKDGEFRTAYLQRIERFLPRKK